MKCPELAGMCDHGVGIFKHTGRKLVSLSIPDLREQVITSVLDALQLALERANRQLESNTHKGHEHQMTVRSANKLQQSGVLIYFSYTSLKAWCLAMSNLTAWMLKPGDVQLKHMVSGSHSPKQMSHKSMLLTC